MEVVLLARISMSVIKILVTKMLTVQIQSDLLHVHVEMVFMLMVKNALMSTNVLLTTNAQLMLIVSIPLDHIPAVARLVILETVSRV